MITGIPEYRAPIEQSLRCVCGLRYLVYLGAPLQFNQQACEAARERTEQMKAQFVDARITPWLACSCGQLLDFYEENSLIVN